MSGTEQHRQVLDIDSSPNIAWHSKHRLPDNPTLDQKVKWHMVHARRCPCPAHDEDILDELNQRYLGKHQDFWIEHNINDQRVLGQWAADCAERLLPYFEGKYGKDTRPREAIKTLRDWVKTGKFSMPVIRRASLAAHASAKKVNKGDKAAKFAAHACGQAVATAHVPSHSLGVVLYSILLFAVIHPSDAKAAVAKERELQNEQLPERLRPWVDEWIKRTYPLLPKSIRSQLD